MKRFRILVVAAITIGSPVAAVAQPVSEPPVEIGGQVTGQVGLPERLLWSGRISVRMSPLTAVEGTIDVINPHIDFGGVRRSGHDFGVHLRQRLWQRGRWTIYGVAGVGWEVTHDDFPETTIPGRDGPQVLPPHRLTRSGLAAFIGPAVQVEVARWLALRGDVRSQFSNDGGLQASVGAVVPFGGFPADSTRQPSSVGDKLTNGATIGGLTGLALGIVGPAYLVNTLCETDDCLASTIGAAAVGGVSGAAVGGLLGAIIDGLIPGRRR